MGHRIVALILCLALFFLVSGCLQPPLETGVIDCGNDRDCFENAAKECRKATMLLDEEQEDLEIEYFSEILGPDGENCGFHLEIRKVDFVPPQEPENDLERQIIEEFTSFVKSLEGTELNCSIPRESISESGVIGIYRGQASREYCSGSFFDRFEEIAEMFE